MLVDIEFEDKPGNRYEVPILTSGGSHRALSVTMPEVNTTVIVGFARYHGTFQKAYIVGTLVAACRSKIKFAPYKAQEEGDPRKHRFRGRKLYPGEVYHSSSRGSEIHLSENIFLEDMSFDTFKIREEDGAIITRSLQNYHTDAARRTWSGLIVRDDFHIIDPALDVKEEGFENEDIELVSSGLPFVRKSSGRKVFHATLDGKNIDEDTPFTEFRASLEELADGVRPVTHDLHEFDFQISNPTWRPSKHQLMEFTAGTLVGDDPIYEKNEYGHVLVPHLFKDAYYFEGDEENLGSPNVDGKSYEEGTGWLTETNEEYLYEEIMPHEFDPKKMATAAMLRFRARNTKAGLPYFSLSKEGKAILHLGASSALDPLGAGRSFEFATRGSVKAVLGRNAEERHSVWFSTRGSVISHIGDTGDKHNTRQRGDRAFYRDAGKYGEHGYHSLVGMAVEAPIAGMTAVTDPELEALSVDTIINNNVHLVVGSDIPTGSDQKSVVLDTAGSVAMALGQDSWGHSFVGDFDGSLEMELGRNDKDGRSLNLGCHGGMQIHVVDGDTHNGQSLRLETATGIHIAVNAPDNNGDGFNLNIRGNVNVNMQGEKIVLSAVASESIVESVYSPDIKRVVHGNLTEIIVGNYSQVVVGNRMFNTTGSKVYS